MADPAIPAPAKLFIGILYRDNADINPLREILEKEYGHTDLVSDVFPFDNTDYYREIGTSLCKVLLSFQRLIGRDDIAPIKLFTNSLELRFSSEGQRRVNIDPGYMTLANVFLASCKDFYHRVYLCRGVYLENEYRYTQKRFHFWPWTYPDYQQPGYLEFFYAMREIYHDQLKQCRR